MYLVHIHLRPPLDGEVLPREAAAAVAGSIDGSTGLEHVVVHSENHPYPVIGFFMRAATLQAAEASAADIWRRACASHQWLGRWTLLRAEVPLLPPAGEWVD